MKVTEQTQTINVSEIIEEGLKKATSYEDYRSLVAAHADTGTSTGTSQSEALTNYTLLNHSRMKRLDKTVKISEEIEAEFKNFNGNQTWLVLTESWCGDAAQSMPAMAKLAGLTKNIDFQVVLRDENIDLMNQFLTNGSMSIPKLVVIDNDTKEIKSWGPRPTVAAKMVVDYKAEHGSLTPEFKKDLQVWYNKDKSQNIIANLSRLIS